MTDTFCCGRKVVHIQAVGDEELEEYIEVDGVVCDNDVEGDVVVHSNEVVVSSEMQDAETYYADNGTTATEEFNMNLPDLLSRHIVFTNGSKLFFCFSKRCRKQLAFEGYLYNIDGYVIRDLFEHSRFDLDIVRVKRQDVPTFFFQIRLRIAVYDLRLMAEFTDLPLETLYRAYLSDEHKDLTHLFPPLDILRDNLEDHRANLVGFYVALFYGIETFLCYSLSTTTCFSLSKSEWSYCSLSGMVLVADVLTSHLAI
ncbi:unnamed protein product, partial [Heligmosomoides polygyrus]|uniref:BTB domain-containing protein n=1 Tax=Heligmosomoides polygyrus TaxID=6339 RepID=A0A183FB72_HELPZ